MFMFSMSYTMVVICYLVFLSFGNVSLKEMGVKNTTVFIGLFLIESISISVYFLTVLLGWGFIMATCTGIMDKYTMIYLLFITVTIFVNFMTGFASIWMTVIARMNSVVYKNYLTKNN